MFRNILTVKNLETTSFIVLSDKKLFSYCPENPTNFNLVINYIRNSGYKYEYNDGKHIFKNEDINVELTFNIMEVGNVLLHDIYNSQINKREFEFFINFIDKPYDEVKIEYDSTFTSQWKHIKNIIDELFHTN